LFSEQLRLMSRTKLTLAEVIARAEKQQSGTVLHIRPGTLADKPVFFVLLMAADKKIRQVHYDLFTGDEVKR
jgi:hypothetical protein